jgi:hypothetical protein
VFEGYGKNHN